MWIAIVCERTTTVVTWNLTASRDEAADWVVDQVYPKNLDPAATREEALQLIESTGFVAHIEEVTHLATAIQWGVRLPNELIVKRTDNEQDAWDDAQEANEQLRRAGATELAQVVERHAAHTRWQVVE